MKNIKKQNAITLIALIVTIIVLLILAGISLSLVAGSNGIINKATTAMDKTSDATILEEVGLVISEATMQYYLDGANESLAEYLAKNYSGCETASGAIIDFDETGEITYSKGKETTILVMDQNGNIEITEKITEGGAILDKSAPTIKIDATTTNSITFTAIDRVGVVAYAVTETAEVPTDWTEITTTTKFTKTVSGKMQNTTYYIWAKDAAENVTFITAKTVNFESFAYTTVWDGAMATIAVSTPNADVQYKTASEDWTDYREPISVASGTTVYFQVTDGINTMELTSVTPLVQRTVTYDANGGTGKVPNTQTVEHTKMVNVDFANVPTRAGYEFMGWRTTHDGDDAEYKANGTKSFEMGVQNVNLYAAWMATTIINHGTSISDNYEKLYVGKTTGQGNLVEYSLDDGYSKGNYQNIYQIEKCCTPFLNPREHLIEPNNELNRYHIMTQGSVYYSFDKQSLSNAWVFGFLYAGGGSGAAEFSNMKLTFADGWSGTVSTAIDAGYLAPLVICTTSDPRTETELFPTPLNLLNGGTTGLAPWPQIQFYFKVLNTPLKGVRVTTDRNLNTTYDGMAFYQCLKTWEISTSPW